MDDDNGILFPDKMTRILTYPSVQVQVDCPSTYDVTYTVTMEKSLVSGSRKTKMPSTMMMFRIRIWRMTMVEAALADSSAAVSYFVETTMYGSHCIFGKGK